MWWPWVGSLFQKSAITQQTGRSQARLPLQRCFAAPRSWPPSNACSQRKRAAFARTARHMRQQTLPEGVAIKGLAVPHRDDILSAEALGFVASLARNFEPARQKLLQAR